MRHYSEEKGHDCDRLPSQQHASIHQVHRAIAAINFLISVGAAFTAHPQIQSHSSSSPFSGVSVFILQTKTALVSKRTFATDPQQSISDPLYRNLKALDRFLTLKNRFLTPNKVSTRKYHLSTRLRGDETTLLEQQIF